LFISDRYDRHGSEYTLSGLPLRDWTYEAVRTEFEATSEIAQRVDTNHNGHDITGQTITAPLIQLRKEGLIEDNGAQWPAPKQWRRKEKDFAEQVVDALVKVGLAKDREEGLWRVAREGIRSKEPTYRKFVEKASKISEKEEEAKEVLEG